MEAGFKQADRKTYLLVFISMCCLISSSVGIVSNLAGIFFTPIATEFGALKGTVSLSLTISKLTFSLTGMLAGKALKRFNVKAILVVSTVVLIASTLLLAASSSLTMIFIASGLRGFSSGFVGYVLVTSVISLWFKKDYGTFIGITLGSCGAVAAVLSPILSNLIVQYGWRVTYVIIAVITLLLHLPAIIFLPSVDPHEKGYYGYGEHAIEKVEYVSRPKDESAVHWLPMVLICILSIVSNASLAVGQHLPSIAESMGLTYQVGTMMLSICMIVNTVGKLVYGWLSDHLGTFKTTLIYVDLVAIGYLCMYIAPNALVMYIGAALYGLIYSLAVVGISVITKDTFGMSNYSKTYPTINMCGIVSTAAFTSIVGYIYDFSGSYHSSLVLMFVFVICYGAIESILALKKK